MKIVLLDELGVEDQITIREECYERQITNLSGKDERTNAVCRLQVTWCKLDEDEVSQYRVCFMKDIPGDFVCVNFELPNTNFDSPFNF